MNWFNKQPVGVRAAIITVCGMIVVAAISALSSWLNIRSTQEGTKNEQRLDRVVFQNEESSKIQKEFKPYNSSGYETTLTANVSLVAFTLDTRHNDLKVEETEQKNYSMHVRGNTYPVFICAFHNGSDKPAIFKGAELIIHKESVYAELSGIRIEPFEAVFIYIEPGFQPFVPPLMLPPGEVGSIHVRLRQSKNFIGVGFGRYHLKFRVNDNEIETPVFLWTQKY